MDTKMTQPEQLRQYVPEIRHSCGEVEIADAVERAADDIERLSAAQSAEPDAHVWYHSGLPNFDDGEKLRHLDDGTGKAIPLYLAPPSHVAIENAALERAAEVCDLMHCRPEFEEEFHDKQLRIASASIRALKQAEPVVSQRLATDASSKAEAGETQQEVVMVHGLPVAAVIELAAHYVETGSKSTILADQLRRILAAFPHATSAQPAPSSGAETDDEIEEMINTLRDFEKVYPEDIFGPMGWKEIRIISMAYPGCVDRISAGMGRHCGKFMRQAADMIEKLAHDTTPAPAQPTPARDDVLRLVDNLVVAWIAKDLPPSARVNARKDLESALYSLQSPPAAQATDQAKDAALEIARDALEEITLSGMTLPIEVADDEYAKARFHARRAWEFIGIAARALEAFRAAIAASKEAQ